MECTKPWFDPFIIQPFLDRLHRNTKNNTSHRIKASQKIDAYVTKSVQVVSHLSLSYNNGYATFIKSPELPFTCNTSDKYKNCINIFSHNVIVFLDVYMKLFPERVKTPGI